MKPIDLKWVRRRPGYWVATAPQARWSARLEGRGIGNRVGWVLYDDGVKRGFFPILAAAQLEAEEQEANRTFHAEGGKQ